jgi:DNA polymerase I
MGRYRRLPDINSRERGLKNHSERAAIDIAMAAMIKLVRNEKLKSMGWKLLLQVLEFCMFKYMKFSNIEVMQVLAF